jgi:SAM-dependent methyltransferase
MNNEELRQALIRLGPWHHDVEIAPGVRTGDASFAGAPNPAAGSPTVVDPERDMRLLIGDIYPDGLNGRSFLDCACNAGGHSFAARKLGARRIYGFDARARWIEQAKLIAQHRDSEEMTFATHTVEKLPALKRFDLCLFRGIFYHLPDPIAGLKRAADLTNELIVVNTAYRPHPGKALLINTENPERLMSGVHGLAWLPTGPEVIADLLRSFGFPNSRVRFKWPTGSNWGRLELLAARKAGTFAYFDSIEPEIRKHAPAIISPAPKGSLLKRVLRKFV